LQYYITINYYITTRGCVKSTHGCVVTTRGCVVGGIVLF